MKSVWTAVLVFVALNADAGSETCEKEYFCIRSDVADNKTTLTAVNKKGAPIFLELNLALTNMTTETALPVVADLPVGQERKLAVLVPSDPKVPFNYQMTFKWIWGSPSPRPGDWSYRLPFASGKKFKVSQSFGGKFSHQGEDYYSVDFEMPEGTEVIASRGGIVAEVIDTYTVGGPDPKLKGQNNRVGIVHEDGTIAVYRHLKAGSARVRVGQEVREGEPIGLSGNTGYSAAPHLHFEVMHILGINGGKKTLPISFRTQSGVVKTLQEGVFYGP
jgi:murein DD-endopeptidase MepM/ murein hydrolase activator NlpD